MPVSSLDVQQQNRYGCFTGEISPEQFTRYFHLDNRDQQPINSHRGELNQIRFAIQLCTACSAAPFSMISQGYRPGSSSV